MNSHYWFSPAPSKLSSSRISLDFGLRSADLYFRELVVPELGRIWFVRQLSWPLAALALHESLSQGSNAPKPTAICHGIEALACKLAYNAADPSERILGRRAFGRDKGSVVWEFKGLRKPANYVRNTHRQAATRALRKDGGLGFATGSRFDLLQLEPVGRDLAKAFLDQRVGKGGTSLRKWLQDWIRGDEKLPSHRESWIQALSPEHPNEFERVLVRSRLLDTSTSASEKRQRLSRAVERAVDTPDVESVIVPRLRREGYNRQADEVVAARAFGAVLDRARDAVANVTCAVERGHGGVKLGILAKDSELRKTIKALRAAAKNYMEKANAASVKEVTSRAFADAVVAADDAEAIRLLVRRAGELLGLADGSVIRGPRFRIVVATDETVDLEDGAEKNEPDRTGRTFRIANLHSLLRDVGKRGAR